MVERAYRCSECRLRWLTVGVVADDRVCPFCGTVSGGHEHPFGVGFVLPEKSGPAVREHSGPGTKENGSMMQSQDSTQVRGPDATPSKPICRFCGSDKGFREFGTVRTSASRELRSVGRSDDGKVKASWGYIADDHAYDDDFDPDGVECRECGREEARLEDLLGDPVMYEPGALVICPDGFKGKVAYVDFAARQLTVEGWHEEFKFAEVTALVGT